MLFVGNDWAKGHHDVYLMDDDGARLGFGRLPEGIEGVARFHEMVGEHASEAAEVVVGIETDRGPVGGCPGGGRLSGVWDQSQGGVPLPGPSQPGRGQIRPRRRQSVSGSWYAPTVTTIVRWPVTAPNQTLSRSWPRTHQNLIWARTRHTNQVRNALREYYPAALETFDDLAHRDALAILGRVPTPILGARLTLPQIRAALQRGGRRRNLDRVARRIQKGLRTRHLTAPGPVADAFGATVGALVKLIVETNRQIADLEATLETRF